ncbi:MAG TPA: hypothetical protein DEF04_04215 [Clostridiales bacterium]|nr:hypothetical protein [Clostridiales bacterium]
MKIEGIVKRIKKNTSCEAVILKTGYILYDKITSECMDIINKIEKQYNMKIYFLRDKNIEDHEIHIDKMGKKDYINSIFKQK